MLQTSYRKIGEATQTTFFAFEYLSPQEGGLQGKLYLALKLPPEDERGIPPHEFARDVYATFISTFFAKNSKAFDALTSSVKEVLDKFGAGLGLCACFFTADTFYSVTNPSFSVYLLRDSSAVKILDSNDAIISASGYPVAGDVVLVGSKEFFATYSAKVASLFAREGYGGGVTFFTSLVTPHEFAQAIAFAEKETSLPEIPSQVEEKKGITLSPYFSSIKSRVAALKGLVGRKKLKLDSEFESVEDIKKRKTSLGVSVILLVLLLVSIGFGLKQKRDKDYKASYEATLVEAIHNFDEAQSLGSLNQARARELFILAKDAVVKLKGQGVVDDRLVTLENQLSEKEGEILGEYQAAPTLFVDLALIGENFESVGMATTDDEFVVLDKRGKRVVRVAFSDKNTKVIAGPSQVGENAAKIGYFSPSAYLLDGNAIYSVGTDKKDIADIDGADLLYAYGGNIYVLTKGTPDIFRLSAITDGFASPSSWLSDDQEVSFADTVSWTIDGAIWLLDKGGKVRKFTQGFEENFSDGLPPGGIEPTEIFTGDELEFIYILDQKANKVVVIDKEGTFIAQYKSDELGSALGIGVSEQEKLLVFLTTNKLYSIELKHLD